MNTTVELIKKSIINDIHKWFHRGDANHYNYIINLPPGTHGFLSSKLSLLATIYHLEDSCIFLIHYPGLQSFTMFVVSDSFGTCTDFSIGGFIKNDSAKFDILNYIILYHNRTGCS